MQNVRDFITFFEKILMRVDGNTPIQFHATLWNIIAPGKELGLPLQLDG